MGSFANQLRVFHGSFVPTVPQDRVFVQLRDLEISGPNSLFPESRLPQLNPEAIESLV
ncbi:hypothetical protein H4R19_001706, partial [Coemansia spiralis]